MTGIVRFGRLSPGTEIEWETRSHAYRYRRKGVALGFVPRNEPWWRYVSPKGQERLMDEWPDWVLAEGFTGNTVGKVKERSAFDRYVIAVREGYEVRFFFPLARTVERQVAGRQVSR